MVSPGPYSAIVGLRILRVASVPRCSSSASAAGARALRYRPRWRDPVYGRHAHHRRSPDDGLGGGESPPRLAHPRAFSAALDVVRVRGNGSDLVLVVAR